MAKITEEKIYHIKLNESELNKLNNGEFINVNVDGYLIVVEME